IDQSNIPGRLDAIFPRKKISFEEMNLGRIAHACKFFDPDWIARIASKASDIAKSLSDQVLNNASTYETGCAGYQDRSIAIDDRAVRLHSYKPVELFGYVGGWRGVEPEKRQNLAAMVAKLEQAIHKTVVT